MTKREISQRATERAVEVAQERTRRLHNEHIARMEREGQFPRPMLYVVR